MLESQQRLVPIIAFNFSPDIPRSKQAGWESLPENVLMSSRLSREALIPSLLPVTKPLASFDLHFYNTYTRIAEG